MSRIKLENLTFATAESLQEGRFSFIKNKTLKINVSIYAQYISFLISLDEEYNVGSLTYSMYKDIVVHTAQIIEGLLCYKLKELIDENIIKEEDVVGTVECFRDKKELHKFEEGDRLIACREKCEQKHINNRTDFVTLNRAGKKSGLLTKDLFEKCEEVRDMRNKIHLSALSNVDDQYNKRDINKIFSIATDVVNRVRDYGN